MCCTKPRTNSVPFARRSFTSRDTDKLEFGPSIFRLVGGEKQHCEFSVEFQDGEDAAYSYTEEPSGWVVQEMPENWEELADEIKVGGTPYFLQEALLFDYLLLQIKGNDPNLPFHLPIGWGWILMSGNRAQFYWQAD